jgi:Ca2+-binding EF-hand superfamily protein
LQLKVKGVELLFKKAQNVDGKITLKRFKELFTVKDKKIAEVSNLLLYRIFHPIFKSKEKLKSYFREVDVHLNELIPKDLFISGINTMNICLDKPLSEHQVDSIFKMFDKDNDGLVNYNDFLNTFVIVEIKDL